jgi:hypothetical protein
LRTVQTTRLEEQAFQTQIEALYQQAYAKGDSARRAEATATTLRAELLLLEDNAANAKQRARLERDIESQETIAETLW